MLRKVFFLAILAAFAVTLVVPAGPVAAGGAKRIDFTAVSTPGCEGDTTGWCSPGELQYLPNGKYFWVGMRGINNFTATDDRWNATCYFDGDPFPPGGGAFPASGTFRCYPTESQYAGGYWVGNIHQVWMQDKVITVWSAKGYGTLDRLEVIVYNTMSSLVDDADPGVTDVGTITELPGYVEP